MKQRPEIALTEMQLCNDADVPLIFKLCSDTASSITVIQSSERITRFVSISFDH